MTDIMCELKDCKWHGGHFCRADHIDLNKVFSSAEIGHPDAGTSKEWREGYYCKRDHHLSCYNYSKEKK
jgi:hypothetical protein